MNILIVSRSLIPAKLYGGTERVIWSLGRELVKMGHRVTFLVNQKSYCEFASVIYIDPEKSIIEQIPKEIEFVHFNFFPENLESLNLPYLITMHGNTNSEDVLDKNTVFISENHAKRYNSTSYVHNGLDWSEYSRPDLEKKRESFHFLGKASWGVKNLKGAIDIIKNSKSESMNILGGRRFEERVLKMGPQYFLSRRLKFCGMVGGKVKEQLLNNSKGLLFPVRWHEPFGLAIIESLFYGCPVFGTTYGSLKELVTNDVGSLSNRREDLTYQIENSENFSPRICHDYVVEHFNSKTMALKYLEKYLKVISGFTLNQTNPKLARIQSERYLPFN